MLLRKEKPAQNLKKQYCGTGIHAVFICSLMVLWASSCIWSQVRGVNLSGEPAFMSVTLQTVTINNYKEYSFETDSTQRAITHFHDSTGTDILYRAITIHNTFTKTIADFTINLGTLTFPEAPSDIQAGWKNTLDKVIACEARWGSPEQKVLYACHTIFPPVKIAFAKSTNTQYCAMVSGGVTAHRPGSYELRPHGLPRIAPGDSLMLEFVFAFGDGSSSQSQIAAGLYERFRAFHQPSLKWADHRPIGAIFLPINGHISDDNPRGWFNDKDLACSGPDAADFDEFKRKILEFADNSISTLQNVNAQGMVVWNLGDGEVESVGFVGDPRMLPILAPEMHTVAEEFFQKFRDAGLRTGVCIRPSQIYEKPDGSWARGTGSHNPDERNPLGDDFSAIRPDGVPWWKFYPVVERVDKMITYAKDHFGSTLFYMDTPLIWRQVGENEEFKSLKLQSCVFRRIREIHPDLLIIPEFYPPDATAHYAYTAQYLQPPYSAAQTPLSVKELLPCAFSVNYTVNLSKDDWNNRRASLVDGVEQGDVLFFRGWFGCSYNPLIMGVYDEVYEQDAVNPGAPAECYIQAAPVMRDRGSISGTSGEGVATVKARVSFSNGAPVVTVTGTIFYTVTIEDFLGRQIYRLSGHGPGQNSVDISGIPAGMYVVRVQAGAVEQSRRFIQGRR
ncbi:MAG: T9SS type A sorting domain-containing protein [Chitinivibrionales bacterium]|nr:T9SS type A sorting domain-containing protein [Chitinivibrionales bacterium]